MSTGKSNTFAVTIEIAKDFECDRTITPELKSAIQNITKKRFRLTDKENGNEDGCSRRNPFNRFFRRFCLIPTYRVIDNEIACVEKYDGVITTYSDSAENAVKERILTALKQEDKQVCEEKGINVTITTAKALTDCIKTAEQAVKQDAVINTLILCSDEINTSPFDWDYWLDEECCCHITPAEMNSIMPFKVTDKQLKRLKNADEVFNRKIGTMPQPETRKTIVICPSDRLCKFKTGGAGKTSFADYYLRTLNGLKKFDVFTTATGGKRFDGICGQRAVIFNDWSDSVNCSFEDFLALADPHPKGNTTIQSRYRNGYYRHEFLVITTNLSANEFIKTLVFRAKYRENEEHKREAEKYGAINADGASQIERRITYFVVIDAPDEACDKEGNIIPLKVLSKDGKILNPQKLEAKRYHWMLVDNYENGLKECHLFQTDNDKEVKISGEKFCPEFRDENEQIDEQWDI